MLLPPLDGLLLRPPIRAVAVGQGLSKLLGCLEPIAWFFLETAKDNPLKILRQTGPILRWRRDILL